MAPSTVRKFSPATEVSPAVRTLRIQSEGLRHLERALAGEMIDRFDRALEILGQVTGRVIVTGMGKSGHIGAKLAATLASTGTPAFFVHPSEAAHGDLGMITAGHVVLALSNSGETPELEIVVAHAKRFAIPLIAITSGARSALARHADCLQVLPPVAEACPHGLAPTTSTTMMLALGDALAIALLERRGFSRDDYRVLHPGGMLGRRLIGVADIMHAGDAAPLIDGRATMAEAILVMTAKSFGCVGLTGPDGRLAGIITDGDLRRHMNPDLLSMPAEAVMTAAPQTIRPTALAGAALGLMNALAITSLFVTDDGRPVGIIHIHDCLRAGVA